MDICLIQVPSHAGDDRHPASAGPGRLLQAGAADLLATQGHRVTTQRADRGEPFRDTASASAAVNRQVAAKVRAALHAGMLPIALAGSCVTCQGVLAGFDHADCGAVWLDAHADFNTPDTSASGFFPGMSLAVVTGHCYRDYWARIGDSTPWPRRPWSCSASATCRPRPSTSGCSAPPSRSCPGTTAGRRATCSPRRTGWPPGCKRSTCTLTWTASPHRSRRAACR
jgi:hypothetical protein